MKFINVKSPLLDLTPFHTGGSPNTASRTLKKIYQMCATNEEQEDDDED